MNYKRTTMYHNIDEVPQERQDFADILHKGIYQTIVLTPVLDRGTLKEKWLQAEQYETKKEALRRASQLLEENDCISIILDDCGKYEKIKS